MFEFSPKFELNINRRSEIKNSDRPVDDKDEQPSETKREAAVPPVVSPAQIIVQVDGFQLFLMGLVVALLILSTIALIHAVKI
jgi:hypothetical protein